MARVEALARGGDGLGHQHTVEALAAGPRSHQAVSQPDHPLDVLDEVEPSALVEVGRHAESGLMELEVAAKIRTEPRWFTTAICPVSASSTMAWMSRSNWDASSSSGNRVSPKMANGRSEASANTTLRPRLFQAHRLPREDDPTDARRLGVHHPTQGERIHQQSSPSAFKHRSGAQ